MGEKGATWEGSDWAVARIAAGQHGVISTRQLLTTGLSKRQIDVRSRLGRLHRVHQGVYAVGHHGLSQHCKWMAAVLACDQDGRRAALSHRSAAELWGLLLPTRGSVDVTVPGNGGRRRRTGIRVHRSRTLEPTMTTHRLGIPVTTPQRTVADLQRTKPGRGGVGPKQL
jgi:predicted transcriptional regulator of viral defense system